MKNRTRWSASALVGAVFGLVLSAGENSYAEGREWHAPGLYANFTIDDPWLTEQYPHLNYAGLLAEMEKANFHTTIAFVPWNYDRSEETVVSLFRENPDRFSVCIHGNDHDHYEFYKHETGIGDPWPAKPLSVHEENIRQALARMAKFKELTGIEYDKVMVFPHGIAPADTLGLLKKYGFLATVNAGNIPLGMEASRPPESQSYFEPSLFNNFVSLDRWAFDSWSAQENREEIVDAISRGRPLLFSAHLNFFEDGINAFNSTAEMVNNIDPRIQWKSLGYISRRLYLQRIRHDGDYDIKAFSSEIVIENTHGKKLNFHIHKEETGSQIIQQLKVDGQPYDYERSSDEATLIVPIPNGESRSIVIEYENGFDISSIDIEKSDATVERLRQLSDFRDIVLAGNVFGRTIVNLYYGTDLYKLGLKRLATLFVALFVLVCLAGWYFRHRRRNRVSEGLPRLVN